MPIDLEKEYGDLLAPKEEGRSLEQEYEQAFKADAAQADKDREREADILKFIATTKGSIAPGRQAEAAQYAAVLPGIDPAYIAEHLDEARVMAAAQKIDWKVLRDEHPVLAKFIRADPAAARMVLDDTATLTDRLQYWLTGKFETRKVAKGEKNAYGQELPEGSEVTELAVAPLWAAVLRDAFTKGVPELYHRAIEKAGEFYQWMMPSGALDEDVKKLIEREAVQADSYAVQGTAAKDYFGTRFDDPGLVNKAGKFTAQGIKFVAEMAPMILASEIGGAAGVASTATKTFEAVKKARYAGVLAANTIYITPSMLHRIENIEVNGEKVGIGKAAALTAVGAPVVGHILGTGLSDVFGTYAYNALGVGAANTVERALASESALGVAAAFAKRFGIDYVVGAASFGAQNMVDASLDEIAKTWAGGGAPDVSKIGAAARDGFFHGFHGWGLAGFGATRRIFEDAGRMVRARETESRLKVMMDPEAAAKLAEENFPLYQRIVLESSKAPGAATHLYLDLLMLQEVARANKLDPREVMAQVIGDGGKLYDETISSNALDIAIPIDKAQAFARASKGPFSELIRQEGRFDPDDYSPGMARRASEAFTAAVEEALKLDPEKMSVEEQLIFDDFRERAEKAMQGTKVEDPATAAVENAKIILGLVKGFQTRMPDRDLMTIYDQTYGPVGLWGAEVKKEAVGGFEFNRLIIDGKNADVMLSWADSKSLDYVTKAAIPAKGLTLWPRSGTPGDYKIDILLFPQATINTLPHEISHALSFILHEMWRMPDTPAAIKQEFLTLVKALGYGSPEEREQQQDPAKEEKFARWFEKYLQDGKAPTPELAPTFLRFGGWLSKLYERYTIDERYFAQFGKLLGPIDPQVKAVLDRFLTSRQAIDQALNESRATRVNKKVREALKTDEEKAAYDRIVNDIKQTAQERLIAAIRARERGFIREERERIENEVREEMKKDAVYRALHFFKTGDLWLHDASVKLMLTNPDTGKPFRLLADEIKQRYGEETLAALRKKKGIVTDDPAQATDLDMMANALKFQGADGLVAGLRDAMSEGEFVKKKTNALLQGMYRSDLLDNPQELAQRAMDAAHNEKVAQKHLMELRALSQSLDPTRAARSKMSAEMWKKLADTLIQSKMLAQIKPEQYARAMGRASEKALKAIEEGSNVRAFDATEAQLLNYYLYRAARKMSDDLGSKYERLAEKATSDSWRSKLGKADPAYRNLHDSVLAAIGLGDFTNLGSDAMLKFIEAIKNNGQDKNLAPWDMDLVAKLLDGTKPWKELTPAEALTVFNAITNIQHIAKTQNEITLAGKRAETQTLVDEAIRHLGGISDAEGPVPPGAFEPKRDTSQEGTRDDISKAINTRLANRDEPRVWLGFLGPEMKDAIWGEFMNARSARERILKDVFEEYKKIWAEYEGMADRFIPIPGLAEALPMEYASGPASKAWLMTALKWFGSESGRKKLLEGTGWTSDQFLEAVGKFLSPADVEHVQREHKISDEKLWPLEAEVYEKRTGLPLEKTKAMSYEIKFSDGTVKTYEGGYWPVKYDKRLSHLRTKQAQDRIESAGSSWIYPSTPHSSLYERTSYVDVPDLNWSDYPSHIAAVIHDYAFGDFVKDAGRVLLDRKMNIAMQRYLGEEYAKQPLAWLERVALESSGSVPQHLREITKAQQWGRSALLYAGLGWNAATITADVLHPIAAGLMREGVGFSVTKVVPSMSRVIGASVGGLISGKNGLYEEALAKSKSLQHRRDMVISEMRRWYGDIEKPRKGKVARIEQALRDTAFWHIEQMDKLVSHMIWDAKYRDVLGKTGDEMQAVKEADEAVEGSMPTHSIMEMSSLMSDKRGAGAMIVFFSYWDKLYQMAHETGHAEVYLPFKAAEHGSATLGQAGASAAMWAGRVMAMLTFGAVFGDLLMGHGKQPDEDWGEWYLRKTIAAPFNLVPYASNLAQPIADKLVTGKTRPVNFLRAPAFAVYYQMMDTFGKMSSRTASDDEKIAKAIELALMMRRLPSRAPVRAGKYLVDVAQGDQKPRGPFDFTSGVMFGQRKKGQEATPFTLTQDAISGK
jgi:hypothetical protein